MQKLFFTFTRKSFDMRNLYLFFLCLFSSITNLTAQKAEPLIVHFDKNFYVAGEDIWYKIYFPNAIPKVESGVVHVEWLSPQGSIIEQQKLPIKANYAIGDLAIPYDWKEGNYLCRVYTLAGLNEQNPYFQRVVPIFNLAETPAEIDESENNNLFDETNSAKATSDLNINLNFNKKNIT